MSFVHKINTTYTDIDSGLSYELPAILTEKGILISHLRYLAWNHSKSESWRERSIFALRLLLTFINTVPATGKATEILKAFTRALTAGTINYDNYTDPTDLYWTPRSLEDSNNLLFHITNYTDFLSLQEGYDSSRLNPFRKATSYEERLNWCAYYNKAANVFLSHLQDREKQSNVAKRVRLVQPDIPAKISNEKSIKFPEEHIDRLIYEGFKKRNGEQDFKSQAMTTLLHFGGLRKSELFHIYTSDITINPNHSKEALVRVYHPEIGKSPVAKRKNRRDFLLNETNFKPRNQYRLTERLYSGWKSPLLTSKDGFFEVVFNPPQKAREFLAMWVNYLKYQRVEPTKSNFHPFAFTNSEGAPETLKNFQRLHKRAVERIGLEHKKENGTSEHGHRHAYGYRCRQAGLSPVETQKSMHHKSQLSSLVYSQPTTEDIKTKLRTIK